MRNLFMSGFKLNSPKAYKKLRTFSWEITPEEGLKQHGYINAKSVYVRI
jgi:hypothetical protein